MKQSSAWSFFRAPSHILHRDRCFARAVRHSGDFPWRGRLNFGVIRPAMQYSTRSTMWCDTINVILYVILLRRPHISNDFNVYPASLVRYICESVIKDNRYVVTPKRPLLPCMVSCGIPQGSVLEPILFIKYIPYLMRINGCITSLRWRYASHTVSVHSVQLTTLQATARISAYTDGILNWMRSNRLQLNENKTELLCAASRPLQLLVVYHRAQFWVQSYFLFLWMTLFQYVAEILP